MENRELNVFTDESVARMAQEGSSTAYEYLIDKYKELVKVKSQKYYIAGGDYEDVIQEGMIGLFKAIRDFDESQNSSFRTFASLCINRQIITAIKTASRQKHRILTESVSLNSSADIENEEIPALSERLAANNADTDPETMMLMKEVVDYLKANGEEIFSPLENRIWNQMLKGKDYREIAGSLRKSTKAIDNGIQRIKRKIQQYLEE